MKNEDKGTVEKRAEIEPIRIKIGSHEGFVLIDFNQPVGRLKLTRKQAFHLAKNLKTLSHQLKEEKPKMKIIK